MARIVFGWEFGASLGHIYPMLRIADVLKERGHEILFVCRDVERPFDVIKARGYALIQAPFWKNPPIANLRSIPTPGYADVLARQGFGYRQTLKCMLSAWDDLLISLKPDLIIADHSPGLNLAVRGSIPLINIGNGFTLPPSQMETFPPIIARGKPLVSSQGLLNLFNDLQKERGKPVYERLPQIFEADGEFACTLPQLDPYAKFRDKPVCGPLEDSMKAVPLPSESHIFVYMANEAEDSELVLKAVQKTGCPATAYIRGASTERRKTYQSDRLEMLDRPVDFSDMLPKASLVIHSGGGGTATSCLMVGRAQIMFPRQSESSLTGRLLSAQELARVIPKGTSIDDLASVIQKTLVNQAMQERCNQVAKALSAGDWTSALSRITDRVEELVR